MPYYAVKTSKYSNSNTPKNELGYFTLNKNKSVTAGFESKITVTYIIHNLYRHTVLKC